MTILLNYTDCENIASEIADLGNGVHTLNYSELYLTIRARVEIQGYDNSNYYGADDFVVTSANVTVISITCGNNDDIEVEYDCDTIERLAEAQIRN